MAVLQNDFDDHSYFSLLIGTLLRVAEGRPYVSLLWTATIITIWVLSYTRVENPLAKVPLVTPKGFWDIGGKKARESFMANARAVVENGFKQVGEMKPFRVISETGEMVILPPSFAHDIRNFEELSHAEFMKEVFDSFIENRHQLMKTRRLVPTCMALSLIRKQLTGPLSETTSIACKDLFEKQEWHEIVLKEELLDLVARLSSTIFLGDEKISKDKEWLRVTKEYTVDSFLAAHQLRTYPQFLWPVIAPFLPQVRKVRAQMKQAEAAIQPIIERRRAEKSALEHFDSVEWLEQVAKEKGIEYRPAAMQLTLALSAIHTTTDLLTTTMYELLQHPEVIPALREEIIDVVRDEGLKHSSLYNLKLMDSVVKEAQRLKPVLSINMVRKATGDIQLANGFQIPKGTRIGVSSRGSRDPTTFPNPDTFDAYRFVRLREQPGQENVWQLTTTRPEQIAFGHGLHACPGRFLAANEVKIALCHMLMKHDWRISPSSPPVKAVSHGIMLDSDPTVKVQTRSRQAEVTL
ncbi:putative cytochrome P450 [Lizonia empirigonia]|nr:putative cytochrome P450 [Lizonia empirigonia]